MVNFFGVGKLTEDDVRKLLASLFVRLVLGNYNLGTGSKGYYLVDAPSGAAPLAVTYVDGYFIRSTVFALYNGAYSTNLDTQVVLNQDSSFVFEAGVWRDTLLAPTGGGGGGVSSDLVQTFLDATPNVNAQYPYTNLQQQIVVTNMLAYMSNYVAWATATPAFKKNTTPYNNLVALHDTLVTAMNGLYATSPNPTNPVACP